MSNSQELLPADETLRAKNIECAVNYVLKEAISNLRSVDKSLAIDGYKIDNNSLRERIKNYIKGLEFKGEQAKKALTQPPKPAMTMYEWMDILGKATDYRIEAKHAKQIITALKSAGVLNVRAE